MPITKTKQGGEKQRPQNNLSLYLKELEKEEQTKSKAGRILSLKQIISLK